MDDLFENDDFLSLSGLSFKEAKSFYRLTDSLYRL